MWSWIILALSSVLLGAVVTLVVQFYFFQKYFTQEENVDIRRRLSANPFLLPESILKMIRSSESSGQKEKCAALNLLFQFLFHELRDTARVRNWLRKKLTLEFEELLTRTAIGKIFGSIKVRDISLGTEFPVIDSILIDDVKMDNTFSHIDSLDLKLDLSYKGGFRLIVDANMLLGKAAYLSIKVGELNGSGRLQFTRLPYSHWSFSFYEEPHLELEVDSQFQGRHLPQITSLISNQIRKSIRKKHTLPNFKLRYKPFFSYASEEGVHASEVTSGVLNVTLHQISRLFEGTPKEGYCFMAVDSLPWVDIISAGANVYCQLDVVVTKEHSSFGISFRQEFLSDYNKTCIIVEETTQPEVVRGDVLVSLDGRHITHLGQIPKVLRSTAVQITVRLERFMTEVMESHVKRSSSQKQEQPESDSSGSSSVSGSPAKQASKGEGVETKRSAQKHILEYLAQPDVDSKSLPRHFVSKNFSNNQIVLVDKSTKLQVQSTDRYLNILIRGVDDLEDSLLGHTNIPLSQIQSSSDSLHYFQLKPPDSYSASNNKGHRLSAQNGFIPLLCYGDILLSAEFGETGKDPIPLRAESPPLVSEPILKPEDKRHEFQRTHLQSSTNCQFCGRKIWFKDAEQCKECGMICHKKCVSKCKQGTVCSGYKEDILPVDNLPTSASNIDLISGEDISTDIKSLSIKPEIVMTSYAESTGSRTPSTTAASTPQQGSAKKGLSNFLASVASAGRGLKRVGSAHNLQLPGDGAGGEGVSKSLPPSPQQTPSPSRKPSLPLELTEDMAALLDTLMQQGTDQADMMDFAKTSGKSLYENLELPQRKEKIQKMMDTVKAAIDSEAESRFSLSKTESISKDATAKAKMAFLIGKSDEKTQALTVLMLHLCAGLQHIQDLEEQEREIIGQSEHSGEE